MNATYTIDRQANLVRIKYVGDVTLEGKLKLIDEIMSDPDFRRGMHALSDFTEATFDWNLKEMDKLRDRLLRIKEKSSNSRWAIVARGGVSHMTAKVFLLIHDAFGSSIEARLFSNVADAEQWLHSPVDVESP